MPTVVTQRDVRDGIRRLGLSGSSVCVHSSLSSFGQVEGGADTVVRAYLEERCTLMVPSFSWAFAVPPPPQERPPRNGWNYEAYPGPTPRTGETYAPATGKVDGGMGAIPAAVVAHRKRERGDHPLCSFSAVGTLGAELISAQSPSEVFAPLATLADVGGFVVLAGVDFRRLTLLHLAEKRAGRIPFRRWAQGARGRPFAVEVGGCSEGFGRLEPVVQNEITTTTVGQSEWKALSAHRVLAGATAAIRERPDITHCNDAECERCNDAVAGGPIL